MHLMSVSKHTTFVVPALTKATRPCFGIVCWESVLRNCLGKLQVHESCFSVVPCMPWCMYFSAEYMIKSNMPIDQTCLLRPWQN